MPFQRRRFNHKAPRSMVNYAFNTWTAHVKPDNPNQRAREAQKARHQTFLTEARRYASGGRLEELFMLGAYLHVAYVSDRDLMTRAQKLHHLLSNHAEALSWVKTLRIRDRRTAQTLNV